MIKIYVNKDKINRQREWKEEKKSQKQNEDVKEKVYVTSHFFT